MKIFEPKLITNLKDYSVKKLGSDLIAGLIVAIIALPLSIALAIASGVSPEKGLYTAIVAGFVIALLGGSSVNISGPTAAFATIVAGIVAQYGIGGLALATIMAGVILIIMGMCRLGALIKYIPYTITVGFTSGIALTIVIGQIKDFMGLTFREGTVAVETMEKLEAVAVSVSTLNLQSILIGIISLLVLIIWPKINKKIPGSLIVVILGTALVKLFDMNVNTIGDLYTISGELPKLSIPEISFSGASELLPSAFTIAILAAIESLLSCVVSDGMISDKHNSNTELIAQGSGNICSGLFGGIPATGAIARTAANVKNGGRTPVSGMVHAIVLLLVLLVFMPYAAWIPMPVIAAILFMVAYNMCEWRQFVKICKTAPKSDILVLILTFILTVVFDLVVAIEIGLLVALVMFMKRMADVTNIRTWSGAGESRHKEIPEGTEVYDINGPIFFATVDTLSKLLLKEGLKTVILRMGNIPALDMSAIKEIEEIASKCKEKNINLFVSHINVQPMNALKKSGIYDEIGKDCFFANIDEALMAASKTTIQ